MTVRFIIYLSIIFSGVLIGAVRYKKLTAPFKMVVLFLFITFISELSSRIMAVKIHNSSPVYHFYVLLLVGLISIIYLLLMPEKRIRFFIIACCLFFLMLSSINSIFFQTILLFPSFSIVFASIVIIVYSLVLFKYTLDRKLVFGRQMIIWLNVSILIYFTIQLFNWAFYNYLIRRNLNSRIISDVGYIANILFYSSMFLMLALGQSKTKERDAIT